MTFYGFEIPKDRKEIIQKLKRTRAGKCVESCKECPNKEYINLKQIVQEELEI